MNIHSDKSALAIFLSFVELIEKNSRRNSLIGAIGEMTSQGSLRQGIVLLLDRWLQKSSGITFDYLLVSRSHCQHTSLFSLAQKTVCPLLIYVIVVSHDLTSRINQRSPVSLLVAQISSTSFAELLSPCVIDHHAYTEESKTTRTICPQTLTKCMHTTHKGVVYINHDWERG